MRKYLPLCILAAIGFVWTSRIYAQIVINEFSSNSDPEWIELYNASSDTVDLSGWKLSDAYPPPNLLTGTISAHGFFVFEKSSGWLNNSGGDTITLKNISDTAVDSLEYGKSTSVVGTPGSDTSAGRTPDGSSVWTNNLTWSKLASNPVSTPTHTPSPTLTPTPQPTSTPIPTHTPQPTNTQAPPPTPTHSTTPSLTPRSSSEESMIQESSEEGTLGVFSASPASGASQSGVLASVKPLIISMLLVSVGCALLAVVFVWKKREAMSSSQEA